MILRRLKRAKQVVFIGNSLTNYAGGNIENGLRYPITCYNTLRSSVSYPLGFWAYSIPGVLTSTLITNFGASIKPYINTGDLVNLWIGTTDVGSGGLTAAQAYALHLQFIALLKSRGVLVNFLTMIPRNTTSFYNEGLLLNALIVAGAASNGYTVTDLTQNSNFDAQADSLNATYYNADALHLTDTGYDLVASITSQVSLTLL